MTKGTVAAVEVRICNNRIMAIEFKTEFLQIIVVRDMIILLKLILLCKINKLIPILEQPFLLFIFVRL